MQVGLPQTNMNTIKKIWFLLFVATFFCYGSCMNYNITMTMRNIFLSRKFNATDSEWILKKARESFHILKDIEKEIDLYKKLEFAQNYSIFLTGLFNDFETINLDIYQLFFKENSFLKAFVEYQKEDNTTKEKLYFKNFVNLKSQIIEVQTEIEKLLIKYYNTTDENYDPAEILSLNQTNFDAFIKQQFRSDFQDYGYFFLEVFATLIGLSWGIISTALHVAGFTEQ